MDAELSDQYLAKNESKTKRRDKKAKINPKHQYLRMRDKLVKLEEEISIRTDSRTATCEDTWTAVEIFLYKTPLFKGTPEYDFALELARSHGFTPFNCKLILRTSGSNHQNQYYFYRNEATPLHLEGKFITHPDEEFIENNILKTFDSDEA